MGALTAQLLRTAVLVAVVVLVLEPPQLAQPVEQVGQVRQTL
jgi:hypothetical protein